MTEVLGIRELGGDDEFAPAPVAGSGFADGEEPVAEAAASVAGASPWRQRAAAGVVVMLFLGVAVVVASGPGGGGRSGESAAEAAAVEEGARASLDAWARFASTGEADVVADAFDPAGPQFARLKAEAPAMGAVRPAGATPYAFAGTVRGVSDGRDRDERVVAADVVVSRMGEADQRFAWELVMRRGDERWRLWTVRDRPGVSTSAPTGGAP